MTVESTDLARDQLIEHILELEPEMFRAMGPFETLTHGLTSM